MKNIILIRHGQSLGQTSSKRGLSRKDPSLQDCFLSNKGVNEAFQLRNHPILQQYDFDLVCTSPLSRALSTCLLSLGHLVERELEESGNACTPFIVHPYISEAGKGIPENQGRRISVLKKDLKERLGHVTTSVDDIVEHFDFSMLPDSWPEVERHDEKVAKKDHLESFLRWILVERPERNVVVVCHYNIIKWILRNRIDKVPNCVPIECILDEDGLFLKSDYGNKSTIPRTPSQAKSNKQHKKSNKR